MHQSLQFQENNAVGLNGEDILHAVEIATLARSVREVTLAGAPGAGWRCGSRKDLQEEAAMELLAEPQVHRWTRGEYFKMAEVGLFEGKHVELIEGQVIEMSPMGSLHATAVALTGVVGGGWRVVNDE